MNCLQQSTVSISHTARENRNSTKNIFFLIIKLTKECVMGGQVSATETSQASN